MINEFVEKLREKSALFSKSDFAVMGLAKDYKQAADIIEELSAKLASANMDRSEQYYSDVPDTNVGKWIPVSEALPEDYDNRFYMCIVENHEEDLPMFCQYEEEYGFGYWQDFYDEHTLGFLDSEFKTNDEFGYEKVIAWQPLPEPYNPTKKEIPSNHYTERFNKVL